MPETPPLKGALIGFGAVAENAHALAWARANAFAIVAVAEANFKRRAAARKSLPGARVYDDLDSLLDAEEGLDFVDIATPPHLHPAQASSALRRGLHVLCEKPLALSREDFDRLRAEAAARDRALFTVHNWKYAPLFQKLRGLLDAGAVGPIRHLEWHTLRCAPAAGAPIAESNWRTDRRLSGGGILVDHGWHAVYLACWLLGAAPRRAAGFLRYAGKGEAETEATCLLEFPIATAVAHLTWNAARRGHRGMLSGKDGSIELFDDRLVVSRGKRPPQTFSFPEPLSRGSAHPDWFGSMLSDFRSAVMGGPERAQNLREAEACVSMIERIYRSSGVETPLEPVS